MLRTLTSALSLAVVAAVTLAAPVHAAPGAGTVAIQGDAGDYITEGLSYAYSTPGDRISLSGDAQHVAVTIQAANGDGWTIDAAAPTGQALTSGTTYTATRYPFNDVGEAGFDYGGNGRGCNTSSSTFTVQTITTDTSGAVTRFAATFVQHCDDQTPAARGQIDVGLATAAPLLQLTVANTGATLTQEGGVVVTGTLTCSSDAPTVVGGVVSQTVRKTTVAGSASVYVDCWVGRRYTWDFPVYVGAERFQAGSVTVSTTATANDAFTGQQVQATDSDSFRLRRPRA